MEHAYWRKFLYSFVILLLVACNSTNSTHQKTLTAELTRGSVVAPTLTIVETIPNTPVTKTPSCPILPSSPPDHTVKPTATPSFARAPVIHGLSGGSYETLFSIPVGEGSIIQYERHPDSIQGPNAIAILPNDNILIADPVGNRLLCFDQEGSLLNTIELNDLGIGYVRDLRVKGDEIFLLETSYQNYRVHRLTITGVLITSEDIPYRYPIDANKSENTLEGGFTGIAIDCKGQVILEVTGGSRLFPLSEVQSQPDPTQITQGILCNDNRYYVIGSGLWNDPQVSAGDILYQTHLTHGFGGLTFLDVFQDGSFYLVRDDVVSKTVVTVDQTVHYIGVDGIVQGAARVPLSEHYYNVMRDTAIRSDGEIISLLPQSDFIQVIRLNFYQELGPLIPGAETPRITTSPS